MKIINKGIVIKLQFTVVNNRKNPEKFSTSKGERMRTRLLDNFQRIRVYRIVPNPKFPFHSHGVLRKQLQSYCEGCKRKCEV